MCTEDYILATVTNGFRVLVVWQFVRIFFLPKVEKRKELVGYLLYLIFILSIFFCFQNPLFNILSNWLGLLVLMSMYEGSWRKKGVVGSLIYAVNMMCDVVAAYLFWDYMTGTSISQIFSIFTTLFVFICQIFVTKLVGEQGKTEIKSPHITLIGVPIVSVIMLTFFVEANLNNRILLVVQGCGILFINILLFFVYYEISKGYEEQIQREHIEEQVRMYQNQLELMQISEKKVRSLRHDMRHHFQVLYAMTEKGQSEKVLQFLEEMQVSLENPKQHIATGKEEVDTIINYIWEKAEQLGIVMDCKVQISTSFSIRMYDSSVILGNLLENAIEAAAKTSKPYVSLRLLGEKNMLALHVKNSYDGVLKRNSSKFISLKKGSGHGLGLRNVRDLVEQKQGSFRMDYDEKEFRVEVVIYV